MKKVKYGILCLSLTGIVFVGCQKENPQPTRTQTSNVNKTFNSSESVKTKAEVPQPSLKWYNDLQTCLPLENPNCFVPVIIRPKAINIIDDIGNASNKGDSDKVINLIKSNYTLLSKSINSEDLDLIIAGKAIVKIDDLTDVKGIIYFIISTKWEVYHVFQLKIA